MCIFQGLFAQLSAEKLVKHILSILGQFTRKMVCFVHAMSDLLGGLWVSVLLFYTFLQFSKI